MTQYGEVRDSEYRIFVHGLDVTKYVRSWERNWSCVSNAPSTLTVVLNNAMQGSMVDLAQDGFSPFVYQDADLNSYYTQADSGTTGNASAGQGAGTVGAAANTGDGPASPLGAKQPLIPPSTLGGRDGLRAQWNPIKRGVFLSRLLSRIGRGDLTGPLTDRQGVVVPGQPIFRAGDAVRLFVRDPDAPTRWFFEFTGVVDGAAESELADGDSTVTLTCEGVLRSLRDSRFASNPGYGQAAANQQVSSDLMLRTWADNDTGFRELTLPEIVLVLAFGPYPQTSKGQEAVQLGGTLLGTKVSAKELKITRQLVSAAPGWFGGGHTFETSAWSVGTFNYGKSAVFVLGSNDREATQAKSRAESPAARFADRIVRLRGKEVMGRYHAAVDTEVRVSDLVDLLALGASAPSRAAELASLRDSGAEVDVGEVVDLIGQNPHIYPCEGNAVYFTSPAALDPETEVGVLNRIPGGSVDASPNHRTRLSALLALAETVDFKVMDTPKGDLLVEMPMYHLHPDDFGTSPQSTTIAKSALVAAYQLSTTPATTLQSGRSRLGDRKGPFGSRFRLSLADTAGLTSSIDAAQVKTVVTCPYFPAARGFRVTDAGASKALGLVVQVPTKGTETTDPLVQRFGIRATEANPSLVVTSREAALAYAKMTLVKQNAQATSLSPALVRMRTGLWPNRPYLVERRACDLVATAQSVQLSGAAGGVNPAPSAATGVEFHYVKHWTGEYDAQRRKVFALFGLLDADPFDYAKFIQVKPQSEGSTQTSARSKYRRKGPQ